MNAQESYIGQVVAQLPRGPKLRAQVAMELRSHIAERVDHGHSVDEALRQLGDPVTLAESYLTAFPLVPATFWRRAGAKIADLLVLALLFLPIAWLIARLVPAAFVLIATIALYPITFAIYTCIAEYRLGDTFGKRLMALRVVRESGGRISLGQSAVRQLPMFLQVGWVDILFALFTENHQRAFEMLSKTRVVRATEDE